MKKTCQGYKNIVGKSRRTIVKMVMMAQRKYKLIPKTYRVAFDNTVGTGQEIHTK